MDAALQGRAVRPAIDADRSRLGTRLDAQHESAAPQAGRMCDALFLGYTDKITREIICYTIQGEHMVNTLFRSGTFKYDGCVLTGTDIHYGKGYKSNIKVTKKQYADLRKHFLGKIIKVGAIREIGKRPAGSLGAWLLKGTKSKVAIASYVAPILVRESYAIKEISGSIRIIR